MKNVNVTENVTKGRGKYRILERRKFRKRKC